jgi:hypothetical protein
MFGRLLRATCDTRLIAVGLIVLQLGLSSGGHLLHAWMHALQDGPRCGSCPLHSSTQSAEARSDSATACCKQSQPTGCCSSKQTPALDHQPGHCCGVAQLQAGTKVSMPHHVSIGPESVSHRCWSMDCAFYRGIHQTSTLAAQTAAISLDQPWHSLAAATDVTVVTSIFFSLRARGPPAA